MRWNVVFHPSVIKEDIPCLESSAWREILRVIDKKLALDPQAYGEPLRKGLFGYWKLRVGAFRVIYHIKKEIVTVFIVKIGARKDSQVYSEMFSRLKKLG